MPRILLLFLTMSFTVSAWHLVFPDAAEGEINLYTDLRYLSSSSKTTDKTTNETIDGKSYQFRQLYNLDLSKSVMPNVLIRGGGIFELNDQWSTTDSSSSDSEKRTARPYVELNLNHPAYTLGAAYRKAEIRNSGSGIATSRDMREEYTAVLGWRPENLPRLNFNYTSTDVSSEPAVNDTRENLFRADTFYEWKGLSLGYMYTYDNLKDNRRGFANLTKSQSGRAEFSRGFFDQRLVLNALYTINNSTTEFSGSGSGTIPVLRSAGLFSLNAFPGIGPALNPDPGLVDGNLAAAAGIDIGLNGDQFQFANIGVDLGFSQEVDTIYVWVDRSIPGNISNAFSWEIYTSDTNTDVSTWTSHGIASATFGTFQNRFEIRFPSVQSRYLKVVTKALSPVIVGSSEFLDIFVTEMETFVTQKGQGGAEFTTVKHDYNMGLKWRVSDKTGIGYDLYFTLQESDPPSTRRTILTHSIDVNHLFNNILAGNARLQRSDQKDGDINDVAYNYSASLRATYLPTFTQILSFTGSSTEENSVNEKLRSKTNAVMLRNVVQLYSGWSADVDVGFNRNEPPEGSRIDGTLVRVLTSIVPNDKISLNLNYSVTWSKRSGLVGESRLRLQTMDFDVNIVPTRTMSFFSRISLIEQADGARVFQNYTANWSPFQGGGLQFFFGYNEVFRSEDHAKETTIGPGLRLEINHRFFFDASYQWLKSDSDLAKADTGTFSSNLKVLF